MTQQVYSDGALSGLIDADGTYTIRAAEKSTNDAVGWSLKVSVSQATRNIDVLEIIKNTIPEISAKINSFPDRGRDSSRMDISLSTPGGKKLLGILKKHPPLLPGKRRDYLITSKINELTTGPRGRNGIYPELNNEPFTSKQKEKISSIAGLFLMYKTTNEIFQASTPRTKKLKDWLSFLNPSQAELDRGLALGQSFLTEIEAEVLNLQQALEKPLIVKGVKQPSIISDDHFAGYHCGDGSLQVQCTLSPPFKRLVPVPVFTATDAPWNESFFLGMKNKFDGFGVSRPVPNKKSRRYILANWQNCIKYIIPLLKKYSLPMTRQKQLNDFEEVCLMWLDGKHQTRQGFIEMVDVFWDMNPQSTTRKLTKEQFLVNLNIYFDYVEGKK